MLASFIMDSFFARVHAMVRKVPRGKVTTYGEIARALGTADARKVGWALHANKSASVPCHRVVNKAGLVSDSFAFDGWREQRNRLEREGVEFASEKGVDLQKYFFAFDEVNPIESKKAKK